MTATVMREDDQRVESGQGCGIADGHLPLLSAVQPGRKVVLGPWIEVLACVLRCCRIPDFAWEIAASLLHPAPEAYAHQQEIYRGRKDHKRP